MGLLCTFSCVTYFLCGFIALCQRFLISWISVRKVMCFKVQTLPFLGACVVSLLFIIHYLLNRTPWFHFSESCSIENARGSASRGMEGILCASLVQRQIPDNLNVAFPSWNLNPVPKDWRTALQEQGPMEVVQDAYFLTFLYLAFPLVLWAPL